MRACCPQNNRRREKDGFGDAVKLVATIKQHARIEAAAPTPEKAEKGTATTLVPTLTTVTRGEKATIPLTTVATEAIAVARTISTFKTSAVGTSMVKKKKRLQ